MQESLAALVSTLEDNHRLSALLAQMPVVPRRLKRRGASQEQIEQAERALGVKLPPSYRASLALSDGLKTPGQATPRLPSTGELSGEAYTAQLERYHARSGGERLPGQLLAWNEHSLTVLALDARARPTSTGERAVIYRAGDGEELRYPSFKAFIDAWVEELQAERRRLIKATALTPDEARRFLEDKEASRLAPVELWSAFKMLRVCPDLFAGRKELSRLTRHLKALSQLDWRTMGDGFESYIVDVSRAEVAAAEAAFTDVGAHELATALSHVIKHAPATRAARFEEFERESSPFRRSSLAFQRLYDSKGPTLSKRIRAHVLAHIDVKSRAESPLTRVARKQGLAAAARVAADFLLAEWPKSALQRGVLAAYDVAESNMDKALGSHAHPSAAAQVRAASAMLRRIGVPEAAEIPQRRAALVAQVTGNGKADFDVVERRCGSPKFKARIRALDKEIQRLRPRILRGLGEFAVREERALFPDVPV